VKRQTQSLEKCVTRAAGTLRRTGALLVALGIIALLEGVAGPFLGLDRPWPIPAPFDSLSTLLLTAAGLLAGSLLIAWSMRGIDGIRLTKDGITKPYRSFWGLLVGRPTVIPFERIVRVSVREAARKKEVEITLMSPGTGKRTRVYPIGWISNEQDFVLNLPSRLKGE
jgi:hypothetical protein